MDRKGKMRWIEKNDEMDRKGMMRWIEKER